MKLDEIALRIGARIVSQPSQAAPVERVYAGDRISDLLNNADPRALLVSNLVGPQLLRVAQLMDVPGICLLNGTMPDGELLAAARDHQTLLMVSPSGMFETCGRIYQCLTGPKPS
jgi:hypothetical protein